MIKMENVGKNIRKYVYNVLSDPNLEWSSRSFKDYSGGKIIEYVSFSSNKVVFIENEMIKVKNFNISLSDIGFTKLELYFPYFGVYPRLKRLVKKTNKIRERQASDVSLAMVWKHIKETDKSFVRDSKLDELGIKD